ncbi:heparin lyase I family protein [Tateyamaria sp. SN6-1]|uniref:heparin lyase I family protein n=1 Tax=Tateyamaria sp. SN6-1 TaxID=3092148 RepID=UPI0039F5C8FB
MKVILTCLLALMLGPALASAQTSMAKGFSFNVEKGPGKHAVTRVQFPDGIRAERFELRAGDCNRKNGDCKNDRERVEFLEKGKQQRIGQDVWVGWSVYVPDDFPRQGKRMNVKLGQFHQRGGNGPRLLIELNDDALVAKLQSPFVKDSDPMHPRGDFKSARLASRSAVMGQWVRIVVNAKWSKGDDGYVNVWVDDKEKLAYAGPTTHSTGNVYFRYGLYRSFVSRCGGPCPTLVAYFNDVKRGRDRGAVQ